MTPVIRIDDEVMSTLKKRAIELGLVFESPNATLRRVLGLDSQVLIEKEDTPRKGGTVMSKFLTIHTPIPVGENRNEYDNCIWINQDTPHWIEGIKRNDRVAVYEVKRGMTPRIVEIGGQHRTAYPPRGGLVSLFEVTNDFIRADDQVPFEDNIYLGKFEGRYISQKFVPLDTLMKTWREVTGKSFNPRIPGGIRQLSEEEYWCIATLMGVQP